MDISDEIYSIATRYLYRVSRSGPYDIMAVCPFHRKADGSQERSPSFALSLTKGLYFCHACEEAGNLYTLLRHLDVSRDRIERQYRDLINAASRNVPPAPNPLRPRVVEESPLPEGLLGLFDLCPIPLLEEGFEEQTLDRFEVGFDKDHRRITFPIRDIKGNLAGVSGRSVVGARPRYKIYGEEYTAWGLPARQEWDKRTVLYNAHVVMPAVYYFTGRVDVFVVEGFKACMWLVQHGLTNTVALMGSYLSWEQQWLLEKMGAVVYLFLDNNEPGQKGTAKAAEALKRSIIFRIIQYPARLRHVEEAQPSDLTSVELNKVKENALTYAEWIRHG